MNILRASLIRIEEAVLCLGISVFCKSSLERGSGVCCVCGNTPTAPGRATSLVALH